MAEHMKLKVFYGALGIIALGGVGALLLARNSSTQGGPTTVETAALAAVGDYEGYVMGDESAPVEIVEFADFQCPACARFTILTASDVKARLVETGLARWRFHDFPLPIHNHALAAHHAAACAGEQGRFWEMHDQLFYNQGRWSRERRPTGLFRGYARAIGLDVKQYEDCMDSNRYAARIERAKQEGVELGVNSTPSFLVGDQLVSGAVPYDSLKVLAERAARAVTQ